MDKVAAAYDRLLNGILYFMIGVASAPTIIVAIAIVVDALR